MLYYIVLITHYYIAKKQRLLVYWSQPFPVSNPGEGKDIDIYAYTWCETKASALVLRMFKAYTNYWSSLCLWEDRCASYASLN